MNVEKGGDRPLRVLTYTTLYPNDIQTRHGVFVENRLRHALRTGRVRIQVVAPVPWFPFRSDWFGSYAEFAGVCHEESRHGIRILHPRYPVIPKVGMSMTPLLMAMATLGPVRSAIDEMGGVDVLDAHYFYPDGVAAALLSGWLSIPLVITARGTDINLIPRYRVPRAWIRWAARRASAMITVCRALKDEMIGLGIDDEKIHVLRNGVDLEMFRPVDGRRIRERFGLDGRVLISVGHLIRRKGHDLVIGALARLEPDVQLLIVGDGPERRRLEAHAADLQVADRVVFAGEVPHRELAEYYSAADVLVLASDREGWPNVLLESMACGVPVVATSIWGVPEVVASPEAGVLVDDRTPEALAGGIRRLLANMPSSDATRRYAERFSWDETTSGMLTIFSELAGR